MNLRLFSIAAAGALFLGACADKTETVMEDNTTDAAIENIMTRTSIRSYDPSRTISRDTADIIVRAAMSAPTARNMQPWAFVVIDDRAVLDSLNASLPYAKMLGEAPLAIVPCGDLTKAIEGEGQSYWIQDVSAATENLLLAAHALGLGAVWTGVYPISERVDAVRSCLGLPGNIIPLAVVPIGYPAAEGQPKDKYNPENIHFNRW